MNADALVSTGQGMLGNNMFAYCGNNPISRSDPSGNAFVHIGFSFDTMDLLCPALGGSSGGGCAYALGAASSGARAVKKLKDIVYNESETAVQVHLKEHGVAFYKGVPVFMTELIFDKSAFSFGIIVMDDYYKDVSIESFSNVLKHERGHTTHFGQIGVLAYSATVAVPSLIGAGLSYVNPFIRDNYGSLPWENIAEQLGGVNGEYLPGATTVGSIYWAYTVLISLIC